MTYYLTNLSHSSVEIETAPWRSSLAVLQEKEESRLSRFQNHVSVGRSWSFAVTECPRTSVSTASHLNDAGESFFSTQICLHFIGIRRIPCLSAYMGYYSTSFYPESSLLCSTFILDERISTSRANLYLDIHACPTEGTESQFRVEL